MDLKLYLAKALELEKIIYTLNRAISWLQTQENGINVTPKNYPEPEVPHHSSGAVDFIADLFGVLLISLVCAIVGIPIFFVYAIIRAFSGGAEWSDLKIIMIVCGAIGFVLSLLMIWGGGASDSGEKESDYERKCREYNELVKKDKQRISRALQQKENIHSQIEVLVQKRNIIRQTLNQLYQLNVIYPKYRNFIAIATFYEYFDSGRCNSLEGHEGAYNIYENEIRLNAILSKLDDVINHLEEIKNNQYAIYSAINEGNRVAKKLYDNSMRLIDNTNAIEQNTSISAYADTITAKNSEILKYIAIFDRL
ncbi:MAG: hypothetical protein Q4C58_11530 [Eubacteriales bacterium]|nr:hypothetical protein [Eubacteriales bacterium]